MRGAAITMVLVLAACGGDDAPGSDGGAGSDGAANSDAGNTGADANKARFPTQIIVDDCAPNDGPALRLSLGTSATPRCALDGIGETIDIVVYTRSIIAPQTVIFTDANFKGTGSYCPGGSPPCRVSSNGSITFDTYVEGVSATGSYSIELGQTTETGTFDAEFCDAPTLCG